MPFTEPAFLFLFLPGLLLVYYVAPTRARNGILMLASVAFYALGEWRFLGWLLASIAVDYAIALGMDATRGTAGARRLLCLGISTDLLLLIVFKYAGFLIGNWNAAGRLLHLSAVRVPEIALPLGISFFTFHRISYKVDVYRGTAEVRRNPLDLLLYILFFPQLIAGPIVRYHDIAHELVVRYMTRAEFAAGIRRFVVGLGKKMLIANTAAACADPIFSIPWSELNLPLAWLGVICYTLQIYFDFSGYSDMAIGLARMFGFHFMENFDYPYISASVTEFWRRWHISLSRWFRDYVYIPLGGNRKGAARTYWNLLCIFFLCGLWHGANWNFVIWGLYFGLFLVAERFVLLDWLGRRPRVLGHLYTMLIVMVGWVFFRAESLVQAGAFLRAMVGAGTGSGKFFFVGMYLNPYVVTLLIAAVLGAMPIIPWTSELRARGVAGLRGSPVRWQALRYLLQDGALAGVFLLSVLEIAAGTYNPFIYFRF